MDDDIIRTHSTHLAGGILLLKRRDADRISQNARMSARVAAMVKVDYKLAISNYSVGDVMTPFFSLSSR